MHSVHRSRGRIFFEVSCALAIAVCLAGAWKQTGASALLAAAAVTALFGLINAIDMLQRRPASVEEPQRIDFELEDQDAPPVHLDAEVETPLVPQPPAEEESEPVPQALPQAIRDGQAKARRKGGRRTAARTDAKVVELATVTVVEEVKPVEEVEAVEEAEVELTLAADVEPEVAEIASVEEATHPHIEPLFEPEPFARMPRRAFGRKAG